ncbi:head GIN domain-containing protein [Pontibacter burrus]|uniref:DUF2807 domain-containing protein n=1 Tax=Pontibacter burrus TaxID=2704466 RepID=A0A6B3LXN7_9BACT|nr:head GIN domain-containing protein [Pontibacter burrus]NEM98400.1 DUF2807 domain-containing protein [Pontibacter burrus]
MMKAIALNWVGRVRLLLLLTVTMLFGSCEDSKCIKGEGAMDTRLLNLDPFRRINVQGDFKVYLTQGTVQKVEIRGEPNILDQVETAVRDDTWKITHAECVRRSKSVEVYITLPAVESLYLNGSGSIEGRSNFTASDLDIELNGSGNVRLDVEAARIISRITGSGKLQLQGITPLHRIDISGSGRVESYDLESESVEVTISGSGIAQVTAATKLDVSISGSGIVYYKGDPNVSQRISGSGKVVKQ